MEPNSFGRRMGIGVRVASRMLRDRALRSGTGDPRGAGTPYRPAPAAERESARQAPRPANLAEPVKRIGQGTRNFGKALAGPLLHTGATLWLEVTGLFFALFALFFAQNVWKLRGFYNGGPERAHLLLFAALTAAFVYLSASSFLRARRRSRRRAR